MTPEQLQPYLDDLLARLRREERDAYIDRRFESTTDFGRMSVEELRYRGMVREQEPDLDAILKHSRVVLLGEPGSGKTVVTLEGAKRLAAARSLGAVPIRASL